jgi:hypothetical protein
MSACHGAFRTAMERDKMSWKPEVQADSSGKWSGNALRFATRDEAEDNVRALAKRWSLVRDTRVIESDDPVNSRWVNGKTIPVMTLERLQAQTKKEKTSE